MTVLKVIKSRRSIRFFKNPDAISKKEIDAILNSAQYAPSAKNLQPIEFIVINDKNIKSKIAIACQQKQPEKAPVLIAIIGNKTLAGRVGKISTHSITTKEKGQNIFIYLDAGACIQNMLLMATEMDIDTLWISSFDINTISHLLSLPGNYIPIAILCVGHRSRDPLNPRKVPIEERTHFNKFDKEKRNWAYIEDCKKVNEIRGEYSEK